LLLPIGKLGFQIALARSLALPNGIVRKLVLKWRQRRLRLAGRESGIQSAKFTEENAGGPDIVVNNVVEHQHKDRAFRPQAQQGALEQRPALQIMLALQQLFGSLL